MKITEVAINRPAFITMVFAALAVLGFFSMFQMGVNLLPEMEWPMVSVSTIYPGAGPREIETAVSKPIEEAIASINDLKYLRSYSSEGVSVVLAEFAFSVNVGEITNEVQRKVDMIKYTLPKEAYAPIVEKGDLNAFPILRLAMSGETEDPRVLYHFADYYVSQRLEQISGVSKVEITGGQKREIRIEVDNDRLRAYKLSILQVSQALQRENMDFPTGKINSPTNQYIVRVAGQFSYPREMEKIVLAASGDSKIYLKDVARVLDTYNENISYTRLDGKNAIGLQIMPQTGANKVKVAELVRAELKKIEQDQKGRYHFEVAQDITLFTSRSINAVRRDLLISILMVALVLLVFLHSLRNAFIVLLAIPTSLISTFIMMWALNYTINMVSLMALALVIGILVDDSIVVLENIHRHLERGEESREAALKGRSEIGFAAIAITLVDVVVFLPIALVGGMIGKIFSEFGITIVISTLLSLLVSFTLTPMLASRWSRIEETAGRWPRLHNLVLKSEQFQQRLNAHYHTLLSWALDHRLRVVIICLVLLVISISFIPLGFIGAEFMRESDRGEFSIKLEMPTGTALEITDQAVRKMEDNLKRLPELENYLALSGASQSEWTREERPDVGQIDVTLIDKRKRSRSTNEVISQLGREAAKIPGLKISISPISMFGAAQESPLQLEVRGPELESLRNTADQIAGIMKSIEGTRDVKTSWEEGQPEIKVSIDRDRAAQLGLSLGEIGQALRTAIEGDIATKYKDGITEYDTRVVLAKMNRTRPEDVGRVALMNYRGEQVSLNQVADIYYGSGPTMISRKERERLITVFSNLSGTSSTGEIQQQLQRKLEQLNLPPDIKIQFSGDFQMMADMFSDMGLAIMFASLFVYMIMVALFESYLHPFTIMFSIPVALVGGLTGLALTGGTLNVFSLIGVLLSLGLVTKNAILLIDRTNDRRSRGLSVREALLEAGPTRLRPILMTTLTMVFGMMPLAMALGTGGEMRQSMAVVVIGALLSSTLLTLVLIPVIYSYFEDLRLRLAGRKKYDKKAYDWQEANDFR